MPTPCCGAWVRVVCTHWFMLIHVTWQMRLRSGHKCLDTFPHDTFNYSIKPVDISALS